MKKGVQFIHLQVPFSSSYFIGAGWPYISEELA